MTSHRRALLAVFGVACSLVAGVSGEVYPARGQRHHRVGTNCRTARYVVGDNDHALDLDILRHEYFDSGWNEDRDTPAALPPPGGFRFALSAFGETILPVSAAFPSHFTPSAPARAPPSSL